MTITEIQRKQQAELHKRLWDVANNLRGSMDGNDFKNYVLGVLFYRFLSEKLEEYVEDMLINDNLTYIEALQTEEISEDLKDQIKTDLGYLILPEHLFTVFFESAINNSFDVEEFRKAIRTIENSTLGLDSEEDFSGLFDDLNLESQNLGKTVKERNVLLGSLFGSLGKILFEDEIHIDVLGDAYEYLIGMYASGSKGAGEYYTPPTMSMLVSKLATLGKTKQDVLSIYDPTCGSGSLLMKVGKDLGVDSGTIFYGQEFNLVTTKLARMNLIIKGINYTNFDIHNGDTLTDDGFPDKKFSVVVANPPYSLNYAADKSLLDDPRFSDYGVLAPKSKADFAFVQHMLYHLEDKGTAVVLLPHGVLFRGAAEGKIRKKIIEDNLLDAVIGLPVNCFYGTSIPVVCLVFKKNRENKDVLFIDASNEYVADGKMNKLSDENIAKIVNTVVNRKDVDKYAHVATKEEIAENDYNCNIPRYVDTTEEEERIDLGKVAEEIKATNNEIERLEKELLTMMGELVGTTEESESELQVLLSTLMNVTGDFNGR